MSCASLDEIVRYCDRVLRTESIGDYEGAVNGLQVENNGKVRRIAAAVDASLATIQKAVGSRVDLLLVHHGLFWAKTVPWTGKKYQLVRAVMDGNLSIYSSHLPLDAHPVIGNNAILCSKLGLKRCKPFFNSHGQDIGFKARTRISRTELSMRLGRVTGTLPRLIPGGPEICRSVGVVSGGAGAELKLAAAAGVDTFITGEGPHWTYALAEELGMNVFYAGHYATETFGVKALAASLSKRFGIPWEFLDHPTGL